MTDVKLKSFIKGNDIQFTAKYFVTGTTTPNTPDATPKIDIQLDGTSLSGYPQDMTQLAAPNEFEHWWNSSAEAVSVYLIRFLALFNTRDTVGELKIELKGESP